MNRKYSIQIKMNNKKKLVPILGIIGSTIMLFSSLQTNTISNTFVTRGNRIGAICNDGWRSYSTGSGTCSHHGGVDYWLYAPSTTQTEYEDSEVNTLGVLVSLVGLSASLYFTFKREGN
jgi:hypothetical protein